MTPRHLERLKALGYMQAPVVVTEQDHWSGFRPDKIEELAGPFPPWPKFPFGLRHHSKQEFLCSRGDSHGTAGNGIRAQ